MRPYLTACGIAAALVLAAPPPARAQGPDKVYRYAFNVAETTFDPAEVSDLYSSTLMATN